MELISIIETTKSAAKSTPSSVWHKDSGQCGEIKQVAAATASANTHA